MVLLENLSFTKCGGSVNYKSLVRNFVALCHSDRAAKLTGGLFV